MADEASRLLGIYGLGVQLSGREILREITFEATSGDVIALLGPNGSGKSTLLRAISGLLLPRPEGQVLFRGGDLLGGRPALRAQRIVYLGPNFTTEFPLSVRDAVRFGAKAAGGTAGQIEDRTERALARLHCAALAERHIESLSGGEQQLVSLARAVAQDTKILCFDETMSKMDLNHQRIFGDLLCELSSEGRLVIFVSHDVNQAAAWSARSIFLKRGKILASGPTRDVFTTQTFTELYPETPLTVRIEPGSKTPRVSFAEPRR